MRCSPCTSSAPHRERAPAEEGEEQAPQPQGERRAAAGRRSREGTGKDASVHELRHRRTLRRHARRTCVELRKALAGAPPADPLAPPPARAAAATSTCAARCAHATRTGEITTLARRDRPHRTRPLLLLIDVSGSLRQQAPDYLRFAWAAQAETFTFGTRLTRITQGAADARRRRRRWPTSPTAVEDADGGTRIGPALQEFLDTPRYADRARGALTIVLSDGLERGDPALMVHAVQRLARASRYRLLWWTPLALRPDVPPDHARDGRDPRRPRRPGRRP